MKRLWKDYGGPLMLRTANIDHPVSPRPYRGFTKDRPSFMDRFHDPENRMVLPSVEFVVGYARVRYPGRCIEDMREAIRIVCREFDRLDASALEV